MQKERYSHHIEGMTIYEKQNKYIDTKYKQYFTKPLKCYNSFEQAEVYILFMPTTHYETDWDYACLLLEGKDHE